MSAGATETDPDVENNTGSVIIRVNEPSSDSGCGSCAVGSSDASGSLLLSLGVLSVLLWRRRRSSQS
jgi:MYXO-CTERM domain-containing protein